MSKMEKIILLIEKCTAHLVTKDLSNVKVKFLPRYGTYILQSLNQGIIKNAKVKFWWCQLEEIALTDLKNEIS